MSLGVGVLGKALIESREDLLLAGDGLAVPKDRDRDLGLTGHRFNIDSPVLLGRHLSSQEVNSESVRRSRTRCECGHHSA